LALETKLKSHSTSDENERALFICLRVFSRSSKSLSTDEILFDDVSEDLFESSDDCVEIDVEVDVEVVVDVVVDDDVDIDEASLNISAFFKKLISFLLKIVLFEFKSDDSDEIDSREFLTVSKLSVSIKSISDVSFSMYVSSHKSCVLYSLLDKLKHSLLVSRTVSVGCLNFSLSSFI